MNRLGILAAKPQLHGEIGTMSLAGLRQRSVQFDNDARHHRAGREFVRESLSGNLMKECTVTDRLAPTARSAMIDIVTILLGFCVGTSTNAQYFL